MNNNLTSQSEDDKIIKLKILEHKVEILPTFIQINKTGGFFCLIMQIYWYAEKYKAEQYFTTNSEELNDSLKYLFINLMFLATNFLIDIVMKDKGSSTVKQHLTFIMYTYFWLLTVVVVECTVRFLQANLVMLVIVCAIAISQILIMVQN